MNLLTLYAILVFKILQTYINISIFFLSLQPCKGAPSVSIFTLVHVYTMCDEYELIVKCLVGILLQAFSIDSSKSVQVKGLTIQNSQQMNFVISRCDSVRIMGVKVSSPGDSPNTDGIHITQSTNVILQDSKIETGS